MCARLRPASTKTKEITVGLWGYPREGIGRKNKWLKDESVVCSDLMW